MNKKVLKNLKKVIDEIMLNQTKSENLKKKD